MKITGIGRQIHCPDCGQIVTLNYAWTGGPNPWGNDLSNYQGKCACLAKISLIVNAGDEDRREYILNAVDYRRVQTLYLHNTFPKEEEEEEGPWGDLQ